ncbi:MAG: hypothetical protein SGJ04_01160 [Bacteroidota bacterium]|nr:hypothetical protein [Bacteroidota bacterium]
MNLLSNMPTHEDLPTINENPSEEFVVSSLGEFAHGEYKVTEKEYDEGELYFMEITVGDVDSGTYIEITYLTKGSHPRGGNSDTTGITVMEYSDFMPFAVNYDFADGNWKKTS